MSKQQIDKAGKVIQPKAKTEQAERRSETGPLTNNLNENSVTQLQQTAGNEAVQRMMAQRAEAGPSVVDEETADSIQRQKGHGQQLDGGIAKQAGNVMGRDFDDVTVHTDAEADKVSRQLGARAFTTGNDIFFREGEYDPQSRSGHELISHELTHVGQQRGGQVPGVQGKLSVNDPNDKFEAEADNTARQVVDQSAQPASVQRAPEEEDVQMKAEDEEVQTKEDEEVQMQEDEEVQMQEDEEVQMQEDEEVQMKEDEEVQMQEDEEVQMQEDEEVQAKRA